MRKVALIFLFLATTQVFAQSRVELGLFVDYLNISQTSTNNFGLGGRFGYRIHSHVMLEGEVAYDYGINFDEAYRNISNGNLTAIERTSIGVTHGLVRTNARTLERQLPSLRYDQSRIHGFSPQPQPAPL